MKFTHRRFIVFFVTFGWLYFSGLCGSSKFKFNGRSSSINLRAGSKFTLGRPLTGLKGLLVKDSNATISGSSLTFDDGAFIDSGNKVVLTGSFNPTTDKLILDGDKTISVERGSSLTDVSISNAGNRIEGRPTFSNVLSFGASSDLTLAIQSPLNKNIQFDSGGACSLTLGTDLSLCDDVTIVNDGTIDVNGKSFSFGASELTLGNSIIWDNAGDIKLNGILNLNGTWDFNSEAKVNGNGNVLDVSGGGVFDIAASTILHLSDVVLRGVTSSTFVFGNIGSTVRMSNVTMQIDSDISLTKGMFYVDGSSTFVMHNHNLRFGTDSKLTVSAVTLWLDKAGQSSIGSLLIDSASNYEFINSGTYQEEGSGGALAAWVEATSDALVVLDTRVDAAETNITTNQTNISSNDTDIATNVANIATNVTGIANNSGAIVATWDMALENSNTIIVNTLDFVSANSAAIVSNRDARLANSTAIVNNDTAIAANSTAIVENDTAIVANSTAIVDNNLALTADSSLIVQNQDARIANSIAIVNNDTAIAANSTAIVDNDLAIESNSTAIVNNDLAIAANSIAIVNNSGAIIANMQAINSIIAEVDLASENSNALLVVISRVDTAESDIVNNSGAIVSVGAGSSLAISNSASIVLHETRLDTAETNITTNQTDISSNDTDITTNQTNISSNDTDIATNVTGIANNSGAIVAHETEISNNSGAIVSVREGSDLAISNSAVIVLHETRLNSVDDVSANIVANADTSYSSYNINLAPNHTMQFSEDLAYSGSSNYLYMSQTTEPLLIFDAGVSVTLSDIVIRNFSEEKISFGAGSKICLGDGVEVELCENESLSRTWTCDGTVIFDGTGKQIDISGSGGWFVKSGGQLIFQDIRLIGLQAENIKCEDDSASILFRNCELVLADEFEFKKGSIFFDRIVNIEGEKVFVYESSVASTVGANSCLYLDNGITFSYNPAVQSKELLTFEDSTSLLKLRDSTLHVGSTGMKLKKGKFIVSATCYITSDLAGDSQLEQGLVIGDNISSEDMKCEIRIGSSLEVSSGALSYKNMNSSSWLMKDSSSLLSIATGAKLKVHQTIDTSPGTTKFKSGSILARVDGKRLLGPVSVGGSLSYEEAFN